MGGVVDTPEDEVGGVVNTPVDGVDGAAVVVAGVDVGSGRGGVGGCGGTESVAC